MFEQKCLSGGCGIVLYTCSILNRTIPQPPKRHFWGQTLLSGGAENEYSRTALASKFSLGMERLSKYVRHVVYSTGRSRNPPRDTFEAKLFGGTHFQQQPGKQCFPLGERLRNRPVPYTTCSRDLQYLTQSFHPKRELLRANIAFRLLLKMSTAEQLWPQNSLLEWKDWANTPNWVYTCSIQQDDSRNPPRDTFGGKHCFPGVTENEYSRTALASKFSLGMERLSKYSNYLHM